MEMNVHHASGYKTWPRGRRSFKEALVSIVRFQIIILAVSRCTNSTDLLICVLYLIPTDKLKDHNYLKIKLQFTRMAMTILYMILYQMISAYNDNFTIITIILQLHSCSWEHVRTVASRQFLGQDVNSHVHTVTTIIFKIIIISIVIVNMKWKCWLRQSHVEVSF